ncbi:hypothetical protein [Mesorhizobium sp.]|uniref:hypothetical protein n=1 Tax=Mesorhizobium sp. TaxID=1871066 RepID=UPI000FE55C18|nr:hypothetical protein [Mesorhizobium sp.]RWP62133.1 MAG: hypothetical protein EOR08_15495 [Mesorhizobium sp.]
MSDTDEAAIAAKAKRERSPSFPFIGLPAAIKRLQEFEIKFGRHSTPAKLTGSAWGMKGWTSQAQQTLAALKAFGLVTYTGSGSDLAASISDDGRTYLRAQQESVKAEVLKHVALKPKAIARYFAEWKTDRPDDAVCLDRLVLKDGFTDSAAKLFLTVYDSTIGYAGLEDSDKNSAESGAENAPEDDTVAEAVVKEATPTQAVEAKRDSRPLVKQRSIQMTEDERELTTGLLSKGGASFRLIVSGRIGEKEIERLIKKLELDKEILSDPEDQEEDGVFG